MAIYVNLLLVLTNVAEQCNKLIEDMAWFQGKVLLVSAWGVFRLVKVKIRKSDFLKGKFHCHMEKWEFDDEIVNDYILGDRKMGMLMGMEMFMGYDRGKILGRMEMFMGCDRGKIGRETVAGV